MLTVNSRAPLVFLDDLGRRYDLHRGIAKQAGQPTYYTGKTPAVEVARPHARQATSVGRPP